MQKEQDAENNIDYIKGQRFFYQKALTVTLEMILSKIPTMDDHQKKREFLPLKASIVRI